MFQPLAQNSYELQEDAVFCVILFLHLTNTTDVSCWLGFLPWEDKPAPTSWMGGGNRECLSSLMDGGRGF